MTTQEIADKLVGFIRQGDFGSCYEMYDENAESIEPKGAMMEHVKGMAAIHEKGKKWNEMVEEVHGGSVSDPLVAGNHFSVTMWNDMTFKETGRQQFDEVCVYEVKDGKIIKEQFFYNVQSS